MAPGRNPARAADESGWQWTRVPSVGTDDPSGKLHIWANSNTTLSFFVKVEVEGPAGTSPYQ